MSGQSRKVKVQFHSGYKGEEIPRSVIFDQKECLIEKIIERKRILDHSSGKMREEYRIRIQDKTAVLKIYDSLESEITFLIS